MQRLALALVAFCLAAGPVRALEVEILWLERRLPPPPVLSNLDPVPDDLGQQGAALGVADSNTTGRFLGQTYTLTEVYLEESEPLTAAALGTAALVVAKLPAADLVALADLPEAADRLIFNAAAEDTALREADCRANLFHTVASRAMRADALAQFLAARRWDEVLLVSGPNPDDIAFAEAFRHAARKFGVGIAADRPWPFAADMRRSAGAEVPLFTQGADYDVLVAADETGDFARYLPYNTWDPRPVAGSAGLTPVTWSRVVEQWGAAQLQSRFEEQAGRPMQSVDYAAWAAVRSVSEAVTRAGTADAAGIRAYLLSDAFQLAGFKGWKMTFRDWNGQLRQPVPLVTAGAVVAMAPLEGYLHERTELDTLGRDRPESACTAFAD